MLNRREQSSLAAPAHSGPQTECVCGGRCPGAHAWLRAEGTAGVVYVRAVLKVCSGVNCGGDPEPSCSPSIKWGNNMCFQARA